MSATALPRGLRGTPLSTVLPLVAGTGVLLLSASGARPAGTAAGVVLAAGALVALARVPAGCLCALLVWLPVSQPVLALLLRAGVPTPVVRQLGGTKELLVAALVVAALRQRARDGRARPSAPERLAVAYVALVGLYVVLPLVVPHVFFDAPLSARLLAWRTDVLFVLAFLATRSLGLDAQVVRRAGRTLVRVAVLLSLVALFESVVPGLWGRVLTDVLRVPDYNLRVFGGYFGTPDGLFRDEVGGRTVVRAGSLVLSPLALGFALLPGLALALERLTGRTGRARDAAVAGLVGLGVLTTITRSAILAGLVVTGVTLLLAQRRQRPGRTRLAVGLLLAALVVAPSAGSSVAGERFAATFSGTDLSTTTHGDRLRAGLQSVVDDPAGRGLATAPGIGDRFDVEGRLTTENAYLQIAAEVGVVPMLVFVALLGTTVVGLARRARSGDPVAAPAAAAAAAGAGLALGGLFLHVWLDFSTAVTFWAYGGAVLGSRQRDAG